MSAALPLAAAEQAERSTATRPAWWSQVAVIGAGYWLYDRINDLNPVRLAVALQHAHGLLHLERLLHLDLEVPSNHWLASHLAVGRLTGAYYDTAHLLVTATVLLWVWLRHPRRYRLLRNALIGTNAIGFATFWLWPLAPPRMLPGFTDVVMLTHAFGSGTTGTGSPSANELAAMPSLHCAYALWCVLAVWAIRPDRTARALIAAHLAVTVSVVLATGNHFFFDVLGGVATFAVAAAVAAILEQRRRPSVLDLTDA